MTTPEPSVAAPPSRVKRLAMQAVRLVLVVLVIWTSVWAAKTVKRIMSGPENAPPVQAKHDAAPPTFAALSDTPEPGFWAFAQQDWALAQTILSPADFSQHVQQRLANHGDESTADRSLLADFQSLGIPVAIGDAGTLYRTGSSGGPYAVTRGKGATEQLVTAGFIMPQSDGQWLLMEMLPTPAATQPPDVSSKSLLPLPPHSRRLMSRWSNSGELILDWIRVPLSGPALVQRWEQAGLRLHKTAGLMGAEASYLYAHQGEVIIVNTFPSIEGGVDLLISKSSDVHPAPASGLEEDSH